MSARPAHTDLRGQVRHTGHGRRSKLKRDEAPRDPRRRSTAHPTPDYYARKALSSTRAMNNCDARRHFEWATPEPMQCLGCRVNKVAWPGAGIRSRRSAARKPIDDSERRTTRPQRCHVSEQRPWLRWSARPQQAEISNSFGAAVKTDLRVSATSHASSRSYIEQNAPCSKNAMNWSTRCDESTCRGHCYPPGLV